MTKPAPLDARAWPARTAIVVLGSGALLLLGVSPRTHAACNAIPAISQPFAAATGAIDRPFAIPGDDVKVTLEGPCERSLPGFCEAAECTNHPEDRLAVTLVFKPPQGPRRMVVLATDCSRLGGELARCDGSGEAASGCCLQVLGPDNGLPVGLHLRGPRELRFRFPDTDARVRDPADDLTLSGPVAVAVSRI